MSTDESIDPRMVEQRLLAALPKGLQDLPIRVDIARHIFRPHTSGPAAGQNYLFDSAVHRVRPLTTNQLFERLPVSHRICRIYTQSDAHVPELSTALDSLIGGPGSDDLTNM